MTNWLYAFLDKIIGLEPKRRWRQLQARKDQLPESYRTALVAIQKYTYVSGIEDGEAIMAMHADLIDLFEQAAANGTPIRDLVGDDPAEFVDAFTANYKGRTWKSRYQDRLRDGINRAAEGEAGTSGEPR